MMYRKATLTHMSSKWCWYCADGPSEFKLGVIGTLKSYEICQLCADSMGDPIFMLAIIRKAEGEDQVG